MGQVDIEELAAKLIAGRARARADMLITPGVYAVFLDRPESLPDIANDNGFLYVGMTADAAGERNHFAHTDSGFSSPRRSLGALLKRQLHLSAMPRSSGASSSNWKNYRFPDAGEAALTQWMHDNLSMSHVALPGTEDEIKNVEKRLIVFLTPPLNLTGWRGGLTRSRLKELRRECREEARAASRGNK